MLFGHTIASYVQFFDLDLASSTLSFVITEGPTGVTMLVNKIEIKRVSSLVWYPNSS